MANDQKATSKNPTGMGLCSIAGPRPVDFHYSFKVSCGPHNS